MFECETNHLGKVTANHCKSNGSLATFMDKYCKTVKRMKSKIHRGMEIRGIRI